MNSKFRFAGLTLAQQMGRMANTYSGFRVGLGRSRARWKGELQPSALSESYTVAIDYVIGRRPKVWILKPGLLPLADGKRIPHTFFDGSVCLHMHEDWNPGMFIADTTIPWLALWLLHYEGWRATGTWLGGGHEPRKGR